MVPLGMSIPSLVQFYVPWCQHSADVMPLISELAVGFKNTSVNFIQSDVSEHGGKIALTVMFQR